MVMVAGFSSCSVKKFLQPGQLILNKNKIEIERPYKKDTERELGQLYKQRPNSRLFLFIKTKPYFYFKGSQGEDSRFKRFQRNVLGEQAVLVDTTFIESTRKSMKSYLSSIGYYYADVTYDVKAKRKKYATVTYKIKQNEQYKFGAYHLQIADRNVYDIVKRNLNESFVRIGNGLSNITLENEQSRIVNLLQNNGYYMMSKDYIDFDIDTTNRNYYAYVGLNIRNPDALSLHRKYYNESMTVEIDQSGTAEGAGRMKDTIETSSFRYIPGRYELNPLILDRNILLFKGNEFKQIALSRTYSRLSDLGIFRFVNIQAQTHEHSDSGFVHYHVKLIPMVKYDYSIEPQATTSDQTNAISFQSGRNFGVAVELKVIDRNVFRGAEMLQFSYRSAFEAQGGARTTNFFNATEQRLTASLIMPRSLLLPRFDRNEKYLSTRTAFNISGIYEVNYDYSRQIFTTNMTYQFNKKLVSFSVVPIEFSYIKSIMSDSLSRRSESDIFLQNLFSNNVILGSRVGLIYTNKPIAKGIHFVYLKWDILEIAGNTLTQLKALTNADKDENGEYTMFGVRYYQYAKSAFDFRFNSVYDHNNASVYRLFAGAAVPYGNTPAFAPFEKRFFVGGANDLRGWLPRSLGPGAFSEPNQLDYSGEIKLEFNAEYRFNVYHRWLEGAFFADMGNIWTIQESISRPLADFAINRFYKELAVDVGFGTRLNFEIFVIRFDFGIPLHDPTYPVGSRWIISDFSGQWLARNFIFNFGIGYPF
jgi:outer membrane protein assembly factor BamA